MFTLSDVPDVLQVISRTLTQIEDLVLDTGIVLMNSSQQNVFDMFESLGSHTKSPLTFSPTTDDTVKGGASSTHTSSASQWIGSEPLRVVAGPAVAYRGAEADSKSSSTSRRHDESSSSASLTSSSGRYRRSEIPKSPIAVVQTSGSFASSQPVVLPCRVESSAIADTSSSGALHRTPPKDVFSIGDESDDGTSGRDYEDSHFWSSSPPKPAAVVPTSSHVDLTGHDSDETIAVADQFLVADQIGGSAGSVPGEPPTPACRGITASSVGVPLRRKPSASPARPSPYPKERDGSEVHRTPSTPRRRRIAGSDGPVGPSGEQLRQGAEQSVHAEFDR